MIADLTNAIRKVQADMTEFQRIGAGGRYSLHGQLGKAPLTRGTVG